jgi:CubicO group peptidase (beta-lactamase class C family)
MLLFLTELSADAGAQSFTEAVGVIAESEDVMGYAAGAVCRDEVTLAYGGLRDYDRLLPVNENTYFRIASVSKLVTAAAALILEQQGVLDLSADAGDYLDFDLRNPGWPEEPVTLSMLLTHTGSVQDGSTYSDFLFDSYGSEDPEPISSLLIPGEPYYSANNWRMEKPGTFFAYSNLNYGLAATVMEAAAGKRFDRLMTEDILPLLGIPGSYNVSDLDDINNLAVLYRKPGGVWTPQADNWQGEQPPERELPDYVPGTNGLLFAPQGGLRTTGEGLMQAALFLLNNGRVNGEQLVSEERMSTMIQPVWEYTGGNGDSWFDLIFAYGLGTHHTTNRPGKDIVVNGHPFLGHPGAAYGLISSMYVEPETQTAVMFIASGVGNGLSFDNRSTFYSVEADVFEAFQYHVFDPCNVPQSTEDSARLPASFGIDRVYPNPFNNRSLVRWNQPEAGQVSLQLWDATGRLVLSRKIDAREGMQTARISGEGLASGMYIVRIVSPDLQDSRAVTLIK